jgi:hypothetical protein
MSLPEHLQLSSSAVFACRAGPGEAASTGQNGQLLPRSEGRLLDVIVAWLTPQAAGAAHGAALASPKEDGARSWRAEREHGATCSCVQVDMTPPAPTWRASRQ